MTAKKGRLSPPFLWIMTVNTDRLPQRSSPRRGPPPPGPPPRGPPPPSNRGPPPPAGPPPLASPPPRRSKPPCGPPPRPTVPISGPRRSAPTGGPRRSIPALGPGRFSRRSSPPPRPSVPLGRCSIPRPWGPHSKLPRPSVPRVNPPGSGPLRFETLLRCSVPSDCRSPGPLRCSPIVPCGRRLFGPCSFWLPRRSVPCGGWLPNSRPGALPNSLPRGARLWRCSSGVAPRPTVFGGWRKFGCSLPCSLPNCFPGSLPNCFPCSRPNWLPCSRPNCFPCSSLYPLLTAELRLFPWHGAAALVLRLTSQCCGTVRRARRVLAEPAPLARGKRLRRWNASHGTNRTRAFADALLAEEFAAPAFPQPLVAHLHCTGDARGSGEHERAHIVGTDWAACEGRDNVRRDLQPRSTSLGTHTSPQRRSCSHRP